MAATLNSSFVPCGDKRSPASDTNRPTLPLLLYQTTTTYLTMFSVLLALPHTCVPAPALAAVAKCNGGGGGPKPASAARAAADTSKIYKPSGGSN